MKNYILIGLCALSLTGVAEADELLIHTVSHHSHGNNEYNNYNFGLGYRTDDGWIFGLYRNSYFKPAAYVAKQWTPESLRFGDAQFGFFVGAATGYREVSGHALAPIGGLSAKYPLSDKWSANVLGTPPIGKMDGVVQLTFSRSVEWFK